jgi:hypothetical protein
MTKSKKADQGPVKTNQPHKEKSPYEITQTDIIRDLTRFVGSLHDALNNDSFHQVIEDIHIEKNPEGDNYSTTIVVCARTIIEAL